MDLVVNHSSSDHQWFQESRKSKDNPYSDYYIWKDPRADGGPPNNWGSMFGGSAWTYDDARDQYYLHYFDTTQPDLNWENPKVRQEVYDLMRYWSARGVDGWRMDVITMISKYPDYADYDVDHDYPVVGDKQMNGPRVHEFIHEMYEEALKPFDMMTVGEAPGSNPEIAKLYVNEDREELDMIFTFEHMDADTLGDGSEVTQAGKWAIAPFDLVKFKQVQDTWQHAFSDKGWNALYLENHDQARVVSRFGDDTTYRERSATAFATVLHGLKGTPFIYQGEEIGMTNTNYTLDEYDDLEIHNAYRDFVQTRPLLSEEAFMHAVHMKSRDNARTPMQWSDEAHAGFTTGKPWLKVNPRYNEINVEKDLASDTSIYRYYQQLIALRHTYDILTAGTYKLLLPEDPEIYAYVRELGEQKWLVIANLSSSEKRVSLAELASYERCILHNMTDAHTVSDVFQPYEAAILAL